MELKNIKKTQRIILPDSNQVGNNKVMSKSWTEVN